MRSKEQKHISKWGSSRCGSAETNLTSIHKDTGSIPDLARWLRIWHCLELWYRSQMQVGSGMAVAVCRPVTTALIQPLAWELPCVPGVALKRQKQKKKQKNRERVKGYALECQKGRGTESLLSQQPNIGTLLYTGEVQIQ